MSLLLWPKLGLQYLGTCDHLAAALGDSNKRVGPLYSLALVASDVLRYHYRLAGHGSDERPNQDALHGVCYELTQRAFRGAWLEIIGAFVGLKDDAGEFMKSYVHFMTSRLQAFTDWMLDDDRDRVVRNFGSYGLAGLDVPQLDYQKLRCSRYHDSIVLRKDDFIYNRVAVYTPFLVNCTRRATQYPEAVLKYLEGTELVVSSAFKAIVLPHMFGLPPLHYNIEEEYVNYAIGGTLLARKFFHVVLNGTWTRYTMEKMLNGRQCYLGMSSRFHDSLKDGDFHDILSTAEAFRVAYSAKLSSDSRAVSHDAGYVAATDTVFFKLACQALCATRDAPLDPNGLRGLPAHAACLYAAGTMPQFHSAFGCTEANDMWHLKECNFM
ncbi:hypothetical protein HPB51_012461 [Rhipicephalus microplus]|uniref:Uncharacterized protein n=1 Tax=Rhipicephalus microplus TaxID=6941 RepID=A0A9J6E9R8_RHIMP|nr:hypothetical protein HPB51_012461 [Rhipicephalus microplus]